MRKRTIPVLAAAALLLVLGGCSREAGPTPKAGGQAGPDSLPIKLDALTTDQCFLSPAAQVPSGCEKYVTQLDGTGRVIQQQAGTDRPLADQATALSRGITAFRSAGCTTVATPGGPCTTALTDIAAAVTKIKDLVAQRPTTG
ncbi:hypothetical protein [Amycolatopsis samaneae]|uniref:DUF732 domain-containing protein n=1 Tax=Amycolatopsis samaneae TaxID=664691 RepID=A0ABW5GKP7_9PSEU